MGLAAFVARIFQVESAIGRLLGHRIASVNFCGDCRMSGAPEHLPLNGERHAAMVVELRRKISVAVRIDGRVIDGEAA